MEENLQTMGVLTPLHAVTIYGPARHHELLTYTHVVMSLN